MRFRRDRLWEWKHYLSYWWKAIVKLTNSNEVIIKSDYGKYNTLNFDTIFSRNVRVDYLENTITGEYLDFSINEIQWLFQEMSFILI